MHSIHSRAKIRDDDKLTSVRSKQRRQSETASPMRLFLSVVVAVSVATNSLSRPVLAFSGAWSNANACSRSTLLSATNDDVASAPDEESKSLGDTRRSVLKKASLVAGSLGVSFMAAGESQAAVGTLPEFAETNAILQGVTIDVADQSQQESMISFLTDAFDFQVLRQRKVGSTTDTVRSSLFVVLAKEKEETTVLPSHNLLRHLSLVARFRSRAAEYSAWIHPSRFIL